MTGRVGKIRVNIRVQAQRDLASVQQRHVYGRTGEWPDDRSDAAFVLHQSRNGPSHHVGMSARRVGTDGHLPELSMNGVASSYGEYPHTYPCEQNVSGVIPHI